MQIKGIILGILILLYFLVVVFLPYILGIIISVIVICLMRRKIVEKNQDFRKIVYIVIVICGCISVTLAPLWYKYASERPNNTYVKMKEINDDQSLIGLSKEQIVELLGDPYGNKDADSYYYDAGKITNYLLFGLRDSYELRVVFDENYIVISTSIRKVA